MKNFQTIVKDVLTLSLFAQVLALFFYIFKLPLWAYALPFAIVLCCVITVLDYLFGKD